MSGLEHFNDPRRLLKLWKEYSGEDLSKSAGAVKERLKK
jgi:hypothetical protein